jgi:hypothetical protein
MLMFLIQGWDRAGQFTEAFDAALSSAGIEVAKIRQYDSAKDLGKMWRRSLARLPLATAQANQSAAASTI